MRGVDTGGESWIRRIRPRTGEGWGADGGDEGDGGVSRMQTAAPRTKEGVGLVESKQKADWSIAGEEGVR